MKKYLLILVIISAAIGSAIPALAFSSGSVGGQIVVVAMREEPRKVPVYMTMPADYVVVPIRVISDQKNSALAYEDVRQTIELISQKAKAGGQFQSSTGVISLARYESRFGISGGSWNQRAASSEISLLVPFTKERIDIFRAGIEATRFIEALKFPEKVRCESGRLQLAINNPEQYRNKLLGLIAEEVKNTRDTFASKGSVRVDGLASSIMVRQVDDRQVELFLIYSLSITTDK